MIQSLWIKSLRIKSLWVLFLISLTCLFSACSSKPAAKPPPPTELKVTILAGLDINPTDVGSAAPLQLRLYELKSQDLFNRADFLDIYLQDSVTLQDTLIRKHLLPVVLPDSTTALFFTLDQETRYVAVLAEFARYQSSFPVSVYRVVRNTANLISLQINDNHIRINAHRGQQPHQQQDSQDGA